MTGPGAPQLSAPIVAASGTPCAIPPMKNALPFASFQTRRVCLPINSWYEGLHPRGQEDVGSHTVCAVMTSAFLDFSKSSGNDLSTPQPDVGFPGLKPGESVVLVRAALAGSIRGWPRTTGRSTRHPRGCSSLLRSCRSQAIRDGLGVTVVRWVSDFCSVAPSKQAASGLAARIVFLRFYPQAMGNSFFDCLGSIACYSVPRSLMDSSAGREDHREQIGLVVEAATGDTSRPI
jgi:hypothetical protein